MQDIHDERRIPLELPKAEAGALAHFWASIKRGLSRRNRIDERQQRAADLNAVWHEADSERSARQPGQTSDIVSRGLRVLGRIGRGSA